MNNNKSNITENDDQYMLELKNKKNNNIDVIDNVKPDENSKFNNLIKNPFDNISDDNVLIKPLNETDPIIYHDPIIKKSIVAKKYAQEYPDDVKHEAVIYQEFNSTKTDGIFYPILKLNNLVLEESDIKSMEIQYTSFYPSIDLEIYNSNHLISFKDTPGQNNIITVIFLPSKDGAYKKISLDFSITYYECDNEDNLIYCSGIYKLLPFSQSKFEGLTYNKCKNPLCNTDKQNLLNTWEVFHEIAKNAGIGFSSTNKCKEINDRLPRLLQNINYYDYINEIIEYSGIDLDSIFDCWIDLYGYLVLVNVSYVLNADINYNNLSIVTTLGLTNTIKDGQEQELKEVVRTITNYKETKVITNLSISDYEILTDPSVLTSFGTLKTYTSFNLEGTGMNSNNIDQSQIQVIEDSIDGKHIEEYQVATLEPVYINVNDYDVFKQKEQREIYLRKKRSNRLKVTMTRINFGLQRGTLVSVLIYEYDKGKKSIILTNMSNNFIEDNSNIDNDVNTSNQEVFNFITNEGLGILNTAISGLYYIDGMEFSYYKNSIIQKLYLIKKDPMGSYVNKHTLPKAVNKNINT